MFKNLSVISWIEFIIITSIPFVNIVFIIYALYSYNVHYKMKKVVKWVIIPIWFLIYFYLYSQAVIFLDTAYL